MVFKAISRRVIEKSVERGARFLDKINPGWDKDIDIDDFSIGSYRRCVLGQLHTGGYQQGVAALGLSTREAYRCGFDLFPLSRWPSWRIFGTESGFDYLNECWKRLIRDRRQTA